MSVHELVCPCGAVVVAREWPDVCCRRWHGLCASCGRGVIRVWQFGRGQVVTRRGPWHWGEPEEPEA